MCFQMPVDWHLRAEACIPQVCWHQGNLALPNEEPNASNFTFYSAQGIQCCDTALFDAFQKPLAYPATDYGPGKAAGQATTRSHQGLAGAIQPHSYTSFQDAPSSALWTCVNNIADHCSPAEDSDLGSDPRGL